MNRKILILSLLSFVTLGAISCNKKEKVENAITSEETTATLAEKIKIDTTQSKIEWKGFKIFKSENTSHLGIIKFLDGELHIQNQALVGGIFTANMKKIENYDITETEMKVKLENHLKSEDFFDVEKFPTAKFEITKVTPSNEGDYNSILEGNLTIKDNTQPLSIRANIAITNDKVSIFSEPTEIYREDFGVNFQSPIENGIIKNEIEIHIIIKANIQ